MGAGDSIFALASGAGRAGLAVLRISGPAAATTFERLSGRSEMPRPRQATLATLRCPESGEILDRGLVIWFPAPASFTGEPVLELHLHGGRAVVDGVGEAFLPRFQALSAESRLADRSHEFLVRGGLVEVPRTTCDL